MNSAQFRSAIGRKIRAARKARKVSQEKLAELAGLHPTYISDIENGKVNASIYSYYQVANALGIPLSELVSLPVGKTDRMVEERLVELISLMRGLSKKKQLLFLSAAKGLISGLEAD